MFINHHISIVLRSTIHHIGNWNYPKFTHKLKYTKFLIINPIWCKVHMCGRQTSM